MSLKASRQKRSPRAMPMETIITRFKSAQQKGQQEKKQTNSTSSSAQTVKQKKSKTNITNSKLVSKPAKKSEKSKELEDPNESKEFCPDKLKRKQFNKKIVLAPKHCLKIIGGTKSTNKRKLHIPQKDITELCQSTCSSLTGLDSNSSKHNSQISTELSVRDMILLIEEEGSLDDEDMLEILTCPSPVWWEDPPDGYIEESIFSREKPVERISVKHQLLEEQNKEAERKRKLRAEKKSTRSNNISPTIDNFDVSELNISKTNRDESFINKRFKLESLLSNIKNKIENHDNNDNRNKTKIRVKTPEDINKQKFKCDSINITSSGQRSEDNKQKTNKQNYEEENFLDLADEGIFSLENIEIPIAPNDKSLKTNENLSIIAENDIRNYKIFEVLTGENNKDSVNRHKSVLPIKRNKNSRILNDGVCIDLCSDNSSDSLSTDQVTKLNLSVKENTYNTTSTDRRLEKSSKKNNARNQIIKNKTIKKTSCFEKLSDLTFKDISSNNSKTSSNHVSKIKINSMEESRSNISAYPISKGSFHESYFNGPIIDRNIKVRKISAIDKTASSDISCNPIEKLSDDDKNSNDITEITDIDPLTIEINEDNSKLDNRTFEDFKNSFSQAKELKTSNVKNDENDKISNDRSRKNSTSSRESDKNMSEEYLDMSIFEDDDMKVELINEIADNNSKDQTVNDSKQSAKSQGVMPGCKDLKSDINNHHTEISTEIDSNEEKVLEETDDGKPSNQCLERSENASILNEPKRNTLSSNENSITRIKSDDKTEYVAVYKIIPNDSDNDVYLDETDEVNRNNNNDIIPDKPEDVKTAEKINRHLDSYYKQRKIIKKYKRKNVSTNLNKDDSVDKNDCISCNLKNKSIVINEDETIKYCLVCSSIYDTEDCKYCIRKSKNLCSCKSDLGEYVCDVCDLKFNSKNNIIAHLSEHNNSSTNSWDHLYT